MSYVVFYGSRHQTTERHDSFADALASYRAHKSGPDGAAIFGESFDGSEDGSDGLSEDEREAVELCDAGFDAPAAVVELFDALKGALAK